MSCTYEDQLLEARDLFGQQIQEAASCKNPDFIQELCASIKCIQDLLDNVVDVDGNKDRRFDITSRAAA